MKRISKIVLTGGPCAGKTTGMSWIIDNFTKRGYKVLVVAETATELITGGAYPWEVVSSVEFQIALYNMLKEKEAAYEAIAENLNVEKVLIICDRGALDAEAYLNQDQIKEFHSDARVAASAMQMMDDYDAVFHLVTAAKGAAEYYTTENNESRKETPEQAAELDDKTIAAWTGHPHLRIIDNSTCFETKMLRLVTEISSFLGEPEPFEIEKKFLIERPDIELLESLNNCQRVEILQTYLIGSSEEEETRVRQRGDGTSFIFTKTTKRAVTGQRRVELEKKLSMSEYCQEIMNADTRLRPIRKTRYCLSYNDSYLEIDIYPDYMEQLDGKCILEVELPSEDTSYSIPDFIRIVEDVTENKKYKNHALAGGML